MTRPPIGKIVLGVIALIVVWHIGSWIWYIHNVATKRKELQCLPNPVIVAEACRSMLGSLGTNAFGNVAGDDPSVPEPLRALKARHVMFQDNCLRLEFHGGSDHFGLAFQPHAPELLTGQWDLVYYGERRSTPIASINWTNYPTLLTPAPQEGQSP